MIASSKCVCQECRVCCWCSLVSDIMSSAKRLVNSVGGSQLEWDKTDEGGGGEGSHTLPATRQGKCDFCHLLVATKQA